MTKGADELVERAILIQLDAIDDQFRRRIEPRPGRTTTDISDMPRTPEAFERFKREWMDAREPYIARLCALNAVRIPMIVVHRPTEEEKRTRVSPRMTVWFGTAGET